MTARAEFSAKTKDAAYKRSGGVCEARLLPLPSMTPNERLGHNMFCETRLTEGDTFYEHINVDHNSKDNSLDNCAVLCRGCWRWKTDHYDKPLIAKTKRQTRRSRGIKRTRKGPPLPGTRASGIKKTFSGDVIDRRTGRPLKKRWR